MKDWYALLSVALVVVVGTSDGLAGTVAFLLAFLITWYLLTARQIGFAAARDRLGFRLEPPVWKPSNWQWIDILFEDDDKFITAVTTALIVVAASLMFWRDGAYIVAALMAAFFVSEIVREQTDPPRAVRIPDARLAPTPLRIPAASTPAGGTSAAAIEAPRAAIVEQPQAIVSEASNEATAPDTDKTVLVPKPAASQPRTTLRKSARRNHRPAARGRARKPTAKRRSHKAQRPPRSPLMPPPSRRAASLVAFKPGKRPPPRPVLRQRQRLRRPMTLVGNKGLLNASSKR